jgi:hypothetical protein
MVLSLARELALAVAVAAAAQLVITLAFFSDNLDAVLADPKTWAIAVAASIGRTAAIAAAVKGRELVARWLASQATQ